MAKILITSESFGKYDNSAKEMLVKSGHKVIDNPYNRKLVPEDIIPYIKEADAIICDLEQINSQVIEAGVNLKAIARRGVGVDSVDIHKANECNIAVMRTPGVVEEPVAELVMAYILELSRRIARHNFDMQQSIWKRHPGNSLFGKTLGVLGLGNIGLEVARKAAAFDMNIIYFSLYRNTKAENLYKAQLVGLKELLQESDFVSIHMPLNADTQKFMNAEKISLMKKSAYLINTARGGLIDEKALAEAVENKLIAGAACDVYLNEPCTDSFLKGKQNTILTPHIATFTKETSIEMDRYAADNLCRFFSGKLIGKDVLVKP